MSRGAGLPSCASASLAGSGATKPATKASISASGTFSGAATGSSAPIGKVAPAWATTRRSMPASEASKTLVIFAVSISKSSSPSLKLSPSALSHPRTLPSVIVRPHFGIVIGVISAMRRVSFLWIPAQAGIHRSTLRGLNDGPRPAPGPCLLLRVAVHLADCGGDLVRARDVELLQGRGERHRGVRCGHPADRRPQRIEGAVGDERGDIGRETAARRRLVDDDQPSGALDAFQDRVLVERRGRARNDQLALDPAFARQF